MDADALIQELAQNQHGVMARRQLAAGGMTRQAIRHRIERRMLETITPEVLRLRGAPHTPETAPMTAVLDAPAGAVLSHCAAAALWDIPGFSLRGGFDVVVPRRGAPRRGRWAKVHYQKDLPRDELLVLRGVPVTSPALTMFHLAARFHPDRVARAFASAWAMGLLTGPAVERLLERLAASGRGGITTIRQILSERGPGYVPPESGAEGRYLQLIAAAGIPAPRRQVDLGGRTWVGRVDYLFDDLPLVVEVVSGLFHASHLDEAADRVRFAALADAGLEVLTVWDHEIWHDPPEVVDRTRKYRWWLQGLIPDPRV